MSRETLMELASLPFALAISLLAALMLGLCALASGALAISGYLLASD